jgi:hypothetical protein
VTQQVPRHAVKPRELAFDGGSGHGGGRVGERLELLDGFAILLDAEPDGGCQNRGEQQPDGEQQLLSQGPGAQIPDRHHSERSWLSGLIIGSAGGR